MVADTPILQCCTADVQWLEEESSSPLHPALPTRKQWPRSKRMGRSISVSRLIPFPADIQPCPGMKERS